MGISLHFFRIDFIEYLYNANVCLWYSRVCVSVYVCCCLCLNKCLNHFENMERIEELQARNIGMPCDPLAFRIVFGEYMDALAESFSGYGWYSWTSTYS